MGSLERNTIMRAQRHGWRVSYVDAGLILMCQAFYRKKLVYLGVWPDGRLTLCRQ